MAINIAMPDDSLTFKRRKYKEIRDILKIKPSGVYFLYDVNQTLLYVGKTVNFQSRLLAHFRGRDTSAEFFRLIDSVTVYFVKDDYEREVYETFAINTFQPDFNKAKTYFNDRADELYEIEERILELENEKREIMEDEDGDGMVDPEFEVDTHLMAGIHFHNKQRILEINKEIRSLKKKK